MFAYLQYFLPHHGISRVAGWLANSKNTRFKNWFIRRFIHYYAVNLDEAAITEPTAFVNFNDFFTRQLKPNARPFPSDPKQITSPVDGKISALGQIQAQQFFSAKGQTYSLQTLLGNNEQAAQFEGGSYFTLYLAPQNYHRVHMPIAGTLVTMRYIPGRIFSVNPRFEQAIAHLYTRNERVVCLFETAIGPMAVILVGALIVGHIETRWHGTVKPQGHKPLHWQYPQGPEAIHLERGEELGLFKLGSTVIVLFGKDCVQLQADLQPSNSIVLGQPLCYPK